MRSAVLLSVLAAHPAWPLDWHEPWREPRDSNAARSSSDEYAWRLFVALNWPAAPAARTADPGAAFGADRAVVWESWQNAGDVYLPGGADPGPWTAIAAAPMPSQRRFELGPADSSRVRHIVDGIMVPLTDPIAGARRLAEIRMNRAAFDFIRARGLHSLEGQLRAAAAGAIAFPPWSREVKAKWRPIGAGEAARYHTVTVTLADGSRRLYGLTALHILSKDLPTWFWATFEHVDNPRLPDGEGWQLPSRDRFACRGEPSDCNRSPAAIGLEGTAWRYYRLRGTMTGFVDDEGRPQRLANSELEAGMQQSASCMTCHSRASIGRVAGAPARLPIFADAAARRGFVGLPDAAWYRSPGAGAREFLRPLDFVWSLSLAKSEEPTGSP